MLGCSPLRGVLAVFAGLVLPSWAMAAGTYACPTLPQGYGPYNYVTDKDKLAIVDGAHFTPEVQSLTRGSRGTIMGDLDYTIRAFPNHHLALMSLSTYSRRADFYQDDFWHQHRHFPVECYFERAVKFAPDDPNVYLVYAIQQHRKGELKAALALYQQALKLAPGHTEAHYNLGLLYIDLNDFKSAKAQAQLAYAKGYPLPGLRNKLKAAGAW